MSESITSRVSRLVTGGINSIVDLAENTMPEAMMNEAIREFDKAIDEIRYELGKAKAKKHVAEKRLTDESNKNEDLTRQIETAVNKGEDELAQAGIAKQLDIEAQIPVLENTVQVGKGEIEQLNGYIAALQGRKREMEADLDTYNASQKTGGGVSAESSSDAGNADDASKAFNRAMKKASGVAGSDLTTDRDQADKLSKLEKLDRDNEIQKRLQKYKVHQEQ